MQLHIRKHHVGMPQTLLAADEILDVKLLITLICKRIHPELLRFIQSMDRETKVCDLFLLTRHIIVAKIFEN